MADITIPKYPRSPQLFSNDEFVDLGTPKARTSGLIVAYDIDSQVYNSDLSESLGQSYMKLAVLEKLNDREENFESLNDLTDYSFNSSQSFPEKIYDLNNVNEIDEGISIIFREINSLLIRSKFLECSQLLERIDINRLSNELLIALLRSSFPARENLPSWTVSLEKIKEKFLSQKRNVKILLYGLEDDN
jgi:hypothetical protein